MRYFGPGLRQAVVRGLLQLLPGAVCLLAWEWLIQANPEYEFYLGSPSGTFARLLALASGGHLAVQAMITLLETVLGFVAGTLLGTCLGLALWASRALTLVTRPYLFAFGAVPVFALGPILIFWFGTGLLSKVVLAVLATAGIAVFQAHVGALEADVNLLRMVRAFGGGRREQFRKVVMPSAAVWVLAGVRLNIGMALLGAFIGEFISSRAGLGHLIIVAEGLYDVNGIWAGVVGLIALASLLQASVHPLERWANGWKTRN